MTVDNSFLIKKFQKFENIFVLFSQTTKLPFVECDEETFDDQVYVFTDETRVQDFARKYTNEKLLLAAAKIPNAQFKGFLTSLYALGVNALMVQDEGAPVRVELEQLLPPPNAEAMQNDKLPRFNPELQLTAIYFLQELRRPVERDLEGKKRLRALEEEMAANLMRSRFIIVLDIEENPKEGQPAPKNRKVKVPYVKTKNGEVFQPCYTDFGEFQKFNARNKNVKLKLAAVAYDDLPKYLVGEAKGFVFNPAGFNLILTKEQMEQMKKNYS